MANDAPAVGRFRTEGGAVIRLDLPLAPVWAAQERRHELVRLPDGDELGERPERPTVAVTEPAKTDNKGLWIEYAVAHGDITNAQAEALSKPQLIERYARTT